jgi:hypothetical protein
VILKASPSAVDDQETRLTKTKNKEQEKEIDFYLIQAKLD